MFTIKDRFVLYFSSYNLKYFGGLKITKNNIVCNDNALLMNKVYSLIFIPLYYVSMRKHTLTAFVYKGINLNDMK